MQFVSNGGFDRHVHSCRIRIATFTADGDRARDNLYCQAEVIWRGRENVECDPPNWPAYRVIRTGKLLPPQYAWSHETTIFDIYIYTHLLTRAQIQGVIANHRKFKLSLEAELQVRAVMRDTLLYRRLNKQGSALELRMGNDRQALDLAFLIKSYISPLLDRDKRGPR